MATQKVFISYSHDSEEHRERVLMLADRLCGDGVDCDIDQYYEDTPLPSWAQWAEDRIEDADWVLVVCTETYERRFRGNESGGTGKGATLEGIIITQALYDQYGKDTRFWAVVFDAADAKHIPSILRGRNHYQPGSEKGYEKLYRLISGQPGTPKPVVPHEKELRPRRRYVDGFGMEPSDPALAEARGEQAPPADPSKYLESILASTSHIDLR